MDIRNEKKSYPLVVHTLSPEQCDRVASVLSLYFGGNKEPVNAFMSTGTETVFLGYYSEKVSRFVFSYGYSFETGVIYLSIRSPILLSRCQRCEEIPYYVWELSATAKAINPNTIKLLQKRCGVMIDKPFIGDVEGVKLTSKYVEGSSGHTILQLVEIENPIRGSDPLADKEINTEKKGTIEYYYGSAFDLPNEIVQANQLK